MSLATSINYDEEQSDPTNNDLVQSLLSRVNELQNQLIELEDNHQVIRDYLLELGEHRGE